MTSATTPALKRKRTHENSGLEFEGITYDYFPFSMISETPSLVENCTSLLELSDVDLPSREIKLLADIKHGVYVPYDQQTTTNYYIPPYGLSRGTQMGDSDRIIAAGTTPTNQVGVGYLEKVVAAFDMGLTKAYDTFDGTLMFPRSQVKVSEDKFTYIRVKVLETFLMKDPLILKPMLRFLLALIEKLDGTFLPILNTVAATLLMLLTYGPDEGLRAPLEEITELLKQHNIKLMSTYLILETRATRYPAALSRLCQSLAAISLSFSDNSDRIAFYRKEIMKDFSQAGHLATALDIKCPMVAKKNSGMKIGPHMSPIVIKPAHELVATDHILLSSKVAGAAIKSYFTNPSQHLVYVLPSDNSSLFTSNPNQKVQVNTRIDLKAQQMFIGSAEHYLPLEPIVKESSQAAGPKPRGATKVVTFAA